MRFFIFLYFKRHNIVLVLSVSVLLYYVPSCVYVRLFFSMILLHHLLTFHFFLIAKNTIIVNISSTSFHKNKSNVLENFAELFSWLYYERSSASIIHLIQKWPPSGKNSSVRPSNGWESSLDKNTPFYKGRDGQPSWRVWEAYQWRYPCISACSHRLKKKTKILHDIQTNYDHQYFYYRVKCFHNFETNESPHNLIITQCMISGEVVYVNCGSLCCRGISILQTRFSYDA